ncbi:flavin reductase family protein [Rhodococcus sovatensis]|uniref:Flavin reductase family protein n=1 Tax=Rhodococcus sovatensis TaxID=1805840 RepID=A0ABZ2PI30_9NOCA
MPLPESLDAITGDTDSRALRGTYGCFPSGVIALASMRGGAPVGLAASSFTSISVSPPIVMVSVQSTSTTWPLLADRPALGLSVLSSHQGAQCRQLAGPSADRFSGVAWTSTEAGAVLLDDALAWLVCSIDRVIRAGDHEIVLLRVHQHAAESGAPLVFHGSIFRSLTAIS